MLPTLESPTLWSMGEGGEAVSTQVLLEDPGTELLNTAAPLLRLSNLVKYQGLVQHQQYWTKMHHTSMGDPLLKLWRLAFAGCHNGCCPCWRSEANAIRKTRSLRPQLRSTTTTFLHRISRSTNHYLGKTRSPGVLKVTRPRIITTSGLLY